MKQTIIYLSGPIDKESGKLNEFYLELGEELTKLGCTVLTPEVRPDDVSRPRAVYCRDMVQCIMSDLILVDARESCGLGVGAEVVAARCTDSATIFISPEPSHYRREKVNILGKEVKDWTHPFLVGLSSEEFIADADISTVLESLCAKSRHVDFRMTLPNFLKAIMAEYDDNYLDGDEVMERALSENPRFRTIYQDYYAE